MSKKISFIYKFVSKFLFQNRSTKQTLVKNMFWITSAEGIFKLLMFFVTIWTARYLKVENYGKLSFAFSFVALTSILTDFGFNALTAREVARDYKSTQKYLGNIISIKIILSILTLFLIFTSINLLGKSEDVKILVYLASIYTVIQGFTQFLQSVSQGHEKMQFNFISKTIYSLSLFTLIFISISLKLDLKYIIISYIGSSVLSFLISLSVIKKYFTKFSLEFDFIFWKEALKKAFPIFGGILCTTINLNLDSTLLSIYRTYSEVGLYQSSYTIIYGFQILSLVHQVTYPKLSFLYWHKDFKKYKLLISRLIILCVIGLIPIGILITFFSKNILTIFYGLEYAKASTALIFLIWANVISFFSLFFENNLLISHNEKKWFFSIFIGVIVNILLNLIFIPKYGFVAASITALIRSIFIISFVFYFNPKILKKVF